MNPSYQKFTKLAAAAAAGEELPVCQEADWQEFVRLAQQQSLQPLLFYAAKRLPAEQRPPQEILEEWKLYTKQAAVLDAKQRVEAEQVLTAAKQEGIPVAMLKGLLLKTLYEKPEMRFMSDLDLWVRPEDEQRMSELLLELGCTSIGRREAQDYRSSAGLEIELHTNLYDPEKFPKWGAYFSSLQQTVLSRAECALEPIEHYSFLLIHFLLHYASQGVGLRWALDLWLFRKRNHLTDDEVNEMCEMLGIESFFGNLMRTLNVLFDDGCADALTDEMSGYILSAGMFGSYSNAVAGVYARRGTSKGYVRRRLFPGRRELQKKYPVLKKLPFLLPFIWLIRMIKGLFTRRTQIRSEYRTIQQTGFSRAVYLEDFHHRTGITAAIEKNRADNAKP